MYLAAVLEYLASEFLDLAGNVARDNNKTLIDSHHLLLAVFNDEELMKLIGSISDPSLSSVSDPSPSQAVVDDA